MKLISMTEFVLNEKQKCSNDASNFGRHSLEVIWKYADFLSQPLTLGMFVPCDEERNVLDPPFVDKNDSFFKGYMDKYNGAKEKVLFEGCTIEKKADWFIVKIGEMPIWVSWNDSKTIESLLQYSEIILTQSAINQIK